MENVSIEKRLLKVNNLAKELSQLRSLSNANHKFINSLDEREDKINLDLIARLNKRILKIESQLNRLLSNENNDS